MEHKDIPQEYLNRDGDIDLIKKYITEIPKELRSIRIWEKDYLCSDNQLTSLKGVPQKVLGGFDFSYNEHLTSLEYMPNYIGDGIYYHSVPNLIVILPICLSTIEGNWYYRQKNNPNDLVQALDIIQKIHRQFGPGVATLVRAKKALDEAGLEKFTRVR